MERIAQVDIKRAATSLSHSARGRKTMRDALTMLDNGAIGLDQDAQSALMTLLTAAFTTAPGSARDAMRAVLGQHREWDDRPLRWPESD